MSTVTVSPKFQVVIPKEVRESLALEPGEQLEIIQYGHRIELIPIRPIQKMRGFCAGMDTTVIRMA